MTRDLSRQVGPPLPHRDEPMPEWMETGLERSRQRVAALGDRLKELAETRENAGRQLSLEVEGPERPAMSR